MIFKKAMQMKTKTILIASSFALLASPAFADINKARQALINEMPIPELEKAMDSGAFTSVELTQASLERIKKYNGKLGAVLNINPDALSAAKAADAARKNGVKSPMLGIPILVKDNVDTLDKMPTTAGSLALKDNFTGRDNPAVAKLRAAGVIILGKTNLSEWANMRGDSSISGWSGLGGQTHNPYDLKRTTCGSSSGTGAGVSASFAVIGIGSETDGSIICPSNMNGLVGLKPTVGLVSRTHVIPISATQDTLGAMGRNVIDVAIMTNIMAGTDPLDSATIDADNHKIDYSAAMGGASLVGKRLGILRDNIGDNPKTNAAFNKTAEKLKAAGAILIEIPTNRLQQVNEGEGVVLHYELKDGLNKYLASTNSKMRTLKDLIAFNNANADKELQFFGQEDFIKAEATKGLDAPEYIHAINRSHDLAGANLNILFETYKLDALIGPSYGPAWLIDDIYGDQYSGKSMSGMAAVAGFPHLSVPMGQVQGMPVGLSFIGKKWDEVGILSLGIAFENLGKMRQPPKLD